MVGYTNNLMKVLERRVEGLIRQRVVIDEMQCGFMTGCGTTDAISTVRQLQEKQLTANKPVYMAFHDLEKKAFDHDNEMSSGGQCTSLE